MEEIIKSFIKKFYSIRSMGYVKSINDNSSGIGLTFEYLLGKKIDCFPLPDFQNTIEIKTKLAFSTKPIHLFKLTPEGNAFFETKRLFYKYGFTYKNNGKVLYGKVFANKMNNFGYYHYSSLEINYKEEKIILLVYDNNFKLIDNSTYWSFKNIEYALLRKLKYLALIDVWSTQKNGVKYYKYYRYNIYKYSNIYTFLNLIEKGIISITFSIDTYKNKERYGEIHDHGTSFDISKEDLNKLFIKLY